LEKVDWWNPIRASTIQSRSHSVARNFEIINSLQCVSRSGWTIV